MRTPASQPLHFHFHCPAVVELSNLGGLPAQVAVGPLGRTRKGDTLSDERPPTEVKLSAKVCFVRWDSTLRTHMIDCHFRSRGSEHLDVMGGRHHSDETLWETALREVAEETGINVRVPEEVPAEHRDFVDAVYRALNGPFETAEIYLVRHDGSAATRCEIIRYYAALVSPSTKIPRSTQPRELARAVDPGWRSIADFLANLRVTMRGSIADAVSKLVKRFKGAEHRFGRDFEAAVCATLQPGNPRAPPCVTSVHRAVLQHHLGNRMPQKQTLISEQSQDAECCFICELLSMPPGAKPGLAAPGRGTLPPTFLTKAVKERHLYRILEGILYRVTPTQPPQWRVYVPAACREAYLEAFHTNMGHPGKHKMLSFISAFVFWPGLPAAVDRFVRGCLECQRHKRYPQRQEPARVPEVGAYPFDVVVADVLYLPPSREGYCELLVFIDSLSRYVEAIPFKQAPTSEQVLTAFVERVLTRHGTPSELRTDRGSALISKLAEEVYGLCGVRMTTSTAHHHKGIPAIVERFNSTLLGMVRASSGGHPGDWVDMLPFLLYTYHASRNRVTQASPAELIYGRLPKPPLPMMKTAREYKPEGKDSLTAYGRQLMSRMRLAWEQARLATREEQMQGKSDFDRTTRQSERLSVNDRVLLYEPDVAKTTNKITRGLAWTGPYRIEKCLPHGNYALKDMRSNRIHHEVHGDRLRRVWLPPLATGEYVVEDLLDVRRSQRPLGGEHEYLVKWMGYPRDQSTWEPVDELQRECSDNIEEFKKHHPGHPAYRVAKKGRTAPTQPPTAPMAPAPAAGPRSTPISSHPTEAKFERGQWMYKVESRRRDGRVTMRWLPSIAVNDSPRLSQLRQQYLATVGSDRATLIALVMSGIDGT